MATIEEYGFTVERRRLVEWLHYATDDSSHVFAPSTRIREKHTAAACRGKPVRNQGDRREPARGDEVLTYV
jgi:hypothetical protein